MQRPRSRSTSTALRLLVIPVIVVLTGCYAVDWDVDPNTFDCNFGKLKPSTCSGRAARHKCESFETSELDPPNPQAVLCQGKGCTRTCGAPSTDVRNCYWSGFFGPADCTVLVLAAECESGKSFPFMQGCQGFACKDLGCPQ